jgi:hypothetical protein
LKTNYLKFVVIFLKSWLKIFQPFSNITHAVKNSSCPFYEWRNICQEYETTHSSWEVKTRENSRHVTFKTVKTKFRDWGSRAFDKQQNTLTNILDRFLYRVSKVLKRIKCVQSLDNIWQLSFGISQDSWQVYMSRHFQNRLSEASLYWLGLYQYRDSSFRQSRTSMPRK